MPRNHGNDAPDKPLAGRELKALRERAGLTQKQVADLLGKDTATVSRWERGFPITEGQQLRLREVYSGDGYATRSRTAASAEDRVPAIALGLPRAVRVWLRAFQLELAEADVPDEQIESAKAALTSPENFKFFVGRGQPTDYSEDEILDRLKVLALAIRNVLRERGFKVKAR
ncbi:MAG: helix-turn-helix transcriptional regulator [Gemmatimonadaceae bacterium]